MNFSSNFSSDNGFFLTAFRSFASKNYLVLALVIIYISTVLGNCLLLLVVITNSTLQTPKYLAMCNLALVDISINTVIIPQMVPVFVFNLNRISFVSCFSQMFFMHFFGDMESFSLALLAYDRVVAICWPLRYSSILTTPRMLLIIAGLWVMVFLLEIFPVVFAARLPYCSSRDVASCCCEHGMVYKLACADVTFNRLLATAKTLVTLLGPLTFILLSYVTVATAVLRIASVPQRWKAFNTCLTHLLLVLIYYIPVVLAYVLGNLRLVQNLDVFTAVLTVSVTLPPMLNPLIYSLKTEELRLGVFRLCGKSKVAQTIVRSEVKN